MLPDLGLSTVPSIIASSTTGYLVQFSPIFLLVGGIILAFVVLELVLSIFQRMGQPRTDSFEMSAYNTRTSLDNMNYVMDEDEEFFRRNGRSGSSYDLPNIRDKV